MRPYISLHVKSLHVGVVTRQMLQRWVVIRFGRFDNGRTTVRPYKSLHVGLLLRRGFNGDGRTVCASLQIVTRWVVTRRVITQYQIK